MDLLRLPIMSDDKRETNDYLQNALQQALPGACLYFIRKKTKTHSQASLTLLAALGGSYILFYAKKDTFNQNTNFVISLEDPTAYTMLAILTDPIKTSLNTNITTRGHTKPQISLIDIIAHTRSILGRNY